MKLYVLLFLLMSLCFVSGVAQDRSVNHASAPLKIPKSAIVEIVLVNALGINHEGSRWEIAYEFRIATDAALFEARKQSRLEGASDERVGDLIKQGSVKASVRPAENRKVVLQIPLGAEIQERLANHPRNRVELKSAKITPEVIKLSREQEMKAQNFRFQAVIEVYDAKLKKTLLIPASRSWAFGSYPEVRFEIKVEIDLNGSYTVNSSLPTKTRSAEKIIKREKTN